MCFAPLRKGTVTTTELTVLLAQVIQCLVLVASEIAPAVNLDRFAMLGSIIKCFTFTLDFWDPPT